MPACAGALAAARGVPGLERGTEQASDFLGPTDGRTVGGSITLFSNTVLPL